MPFTCSAHRCASSLCCISFANASACLTAALAVAKMPPHQPPPELCAWVVGIVPVARFSGSRSPSLSVAGVKLVWNDLELSPDFLGGAFSSLDRAPSFEGGVLMPARLGEAFEDCVVLEDAKRGVCGRLVGRWRSGIAVSSGKSSWSGPFDVDGAGWESFEVASTSPPSSFNWARRSSSVGLANFPDIVATQKLVHLNNSIGLAGGAISSAFVF